MSNHNNLGRAVADRTNLYDDITKKIVAELEAGRFPWVQPWGTAAAKAPLCLPRNASTSRAYSGINVLILWGAVIECGYLTQNWLTFRQALALGGSVRKGEHGTTVVYADRFVPNEEKKRARETGEDARAVPFLKRFTVFNIEQCESLPDEIAISPPLPDAGLIESRVEALIKATGIEFHIGGNRAYYTPAHDRVQVPPPQAFFEPINWHRTALHELGHYADIKIMSASAPSEPEAVASGSSGIGIIRGIRGKRGACRPADIVPGWRRGQSRGQRLFLQPQIRMNIHLRGLDILVPKPERDNWTAPGLADNSQPHAAALSNASGLMPPKKLCRRVRL